MTTTSTRAREDRLLTGISRRHNVEGLVADQVLTPVTAKKSTGLIGKFGNEHLRVVHDLVGGLTEYPQITVDTKSSDRYSMEKHGLGVTVTEEEMDNEEQPFDALIDATMDVNDRLALGREFAISSVLTNIAVLTNNTTLSGTAQFSDYSGTSDPIGIFQTARTSIYDDTGKDVSMPGGFVLLPWACRSALQFHPALLELYKYTGSMGNGLTDQQLADVLKVNRIVFASSQFDSSKEGQTPVITATWGKHIIFGFAPTSGRKRMTSLGFTVSKTRSTRTFRVAIKDPPNAEKILVDRTYDDIITDVGAGYLIKDAVA